MESALLCLVSYLQRSLLVISPELLEMKWQRCILGVGLSTITIVFYTMCYYAVILAWALFYLFQSWKSVLPWSTCNNTWNTATCESNYTSLMGANMTAIEANLTSPVIEYWE